MDNRNEQPKMDTQSSYDAVASDYRQKFLHELEHKPFDRARLDEFAAQLKDKRVWDIGCGPGQVTRYLHEQGVQATGVDLSPEMIAQAKQAHADRPDLEFLVRDMRDLQIADGALAGIVSFYAIIHIPREDVIAVLKEWGRALQAGGRVLMSFHKGQEIRHLDDWWEKPVNLDFLFFERAEMEGYLQAAGFKIEHVWERGPIPDVEAQTQRVYILAVKPD
jgi:SAM-dependent methyltransferase